MEVIFECFFEETFARLERSGLQARQKRRDVIDHLSAIISGCCQGTQMIVGSIWHISWWFNVWGFLLGVAALGQWIGQDLKPEEAGKLAVEAAIVYHRQKKAENNQVLSFELDWIFPDLIEERLQICLMGKYHNVLYIGMKVAWDWGVTDSAVIKELLGKYANEVLFCCSINESCKSIIKSRGNFRMRKNIRTHISWRNIRYECAAFYCRMEKRFYRSGYTWTKLWLSPAAMHTSIC